MIGKKLPVGVSVIYTNSEGVSYEATILPDNNYTMKKQNNIQITGYIDTECDIRIGATGNTHIRYLQFISEDEKFLSSLYNTGTVRSEEEEEHGIA